MLSDKTRNVVQSDLKILRSELRQSPIAGGVALAGTTSDGQAMPEPQVEFGRQIWFNELGPA